MKAIGYGRISKAEAGSASAGIEVQRRACEQYARAHGMEFQWIADEGVSGAIAPEARKGLKAGLAMLEAALADVLVVLRIDRASRRAEDFSRLLNLAESQGWHVVVVELGIDTRTPAGKMVAQVIAAVAEMERDYIRTRTREALAIKRENGTVLGRPSNVPEDVMLRICREDTAGKSAYAIARDLNADAVPTAQGGKQWHANTVKAILGRVERETA